MSSHIHSVQVGYFNCLFASCTPGEGKRPSRSFRVVHLWRQASHISRRLFDISFHSLHSVFYLQKQAFHSVMLFWCAYKERNWLWWAL